MIRIKKKEHKCNKKQEFSVEELLIKNLTNENDKFEDKMARLKAIFQVNNYNNEKLMLNKIKAIIYE